MKFLIKLICFLVLSASAIAQIPEKPMITATGKAIVYAEPDEVIINIRIYNEGKNLQEAKHASDKIAKALFGYCKQMGIEDKHVQTDYLNITTNIRNYRNEIQDIIFSASQNISVCIKDINKYEELIEGFISRGVYGISSSQFRTTEMRKYQDIARVKAIKAAKEKAILLATELGQKVGSAHYISEVNYNRQQPLTRMAYANSMSDMAGDGSGESIISPGQLVVTAEIEVTFILE